MISQIYGYCQNNIQTWHVVIITIIVSAGLGYAGGRYVQPAKEVIKTVEVTKTVQVIQHDTVTVVKEVKHPDGTTETDTTITNKDKDSTASSSTNTSSETITNLKPQWKVDALYGYDAQDLRPVYGAQVQRRIIGPIFVGVWGNSRQTAGVSVGLEF